MGPATDIVEDVMIGDIDASEDSPVDLSMHKEVNEHLTEDTANQTAGQTTDEQVGPSVK